jgi:outer membrane protein assembly factor BamA
MYTAPTHYVEAFTSWQHDFLPATRNPIAGAEQFNDQSNVGVHYHADFMSPYWNPDTGFKFDVTYALGVPVLGEPELTNQVMGQISWVHKLPADLGYLSDTRLAYRIYGAAAFPQNAQVFSLGGNQLFRGFDLSERQGSSMWIASAEWRMPIVQDVEWDAVDHVVGLRNLYAAPFCDVGNAYINGQATGATAVAVGIGLRAEFAWVSFIERTTFRLDIAKTVNESSPFQFWIGIQNPF